MVAYHGAHVVVTGGTGALGTAVVTALRAAGAVCHVTNIVAAELERYPHRDDPGVHITRDLDLAELYDGFTFLTIAWLEALGICGDGEGGPFVDGATRIARDGALPLNTYGGQLSAGRMHGYWILHEACLQLRGDADTRQLPRRPEVAVAAVGGGPIAGCMLLTC